MCSLDYILQTDLSNKFFIVSKELEPKYFGCSWDKKFGKVFQFDINKNLQTNDITVSHFKKDKNLISVNENVYRINYYSYRSVCGNNFNMHVFSAVNFKLIQFLGQRPKDCFCHSKYEQFKIIKSNKNMSPNKLYLKHSELFKHPQEISNLKHRCKMECPSESKYKQLNNLADDLQAIENIKEDDFVKHVFYIDSNVDRNNKDLPAAIMIINDMLSCALKSKLILYFDKTFDTSIYHLSTISYKSNRVLTRKYKNPLRYLGCFYFIKVVAKK